MLYLCLNDVIKSYKTGTLRFTRSCYETRAQVCMFVRIPYVSPRSDDSHEPDNPEYLA